MLVTPVTPLAKEGVGVIVSRNLEIYIISDKNNGNNSKDYIASQC